MSGWAQRLEAPEPRPARVISAPIRVTGESTPYGRAALEREATSVAGTGEGSRNETLYNASYRIGQLIAGGEIPERDAREALTSAGRACGLGDGEIMKCIDSGIGRSEGDPRTAPPRPNCDPITGSDDEPELSKLDSCSQPSFEEPLRGLRHLGAVALLGRSKILELAARPICYVWQDIAPPGVITLFGGKPGEGKTTLLFLVLLCRANLEGPIILLDRQIQPAPPGQYLVLIEGEHSEASTSRKLVKSAKLLGVDDQALDRIIIVARKAVRLGSPEWQDVVRLVAAGLVSDIAIDTVARVAPGDGDSEQEQVAIFDGVAQAIEQAPETVLPPNVWGVAHLRKNGNNGSLDDVAGSVQRTGQADTVLLLTAERLDGRVVSTRVVFAKLREDPDEYPEPAEIVIENGVLKTAAIVCGPTDARPLEDRICEQLASGPKTKTAISKALKRNKSDLEPAFSALFGSRRIESTTVTIKGQDYTAFQIRTPYVDHDGRTPDAPPDEAVPC